jgi:hypothetical protein
MSTLTHSASLSRAAVQRALLVVVAVATAMVLVALTTAWFMRVDQASSFDVPVPVYSFGNSPDPCHNAVLGETLAC